MVLQRYTIGLVIGAVLGGRLADRVGRKKVLIGAVTTFGLFSILTALASGFETLVLMRLLTGLGLGGALPNLIALTSENVPERRSLAVSLMYCGMPFGGGLASLLVALSQGALDWKVVFYVGGLAPLIVAPILFFLITESVRVRPPPGSRMGSAFTTLFGEGRGPWTLALWVRPPRSTTDFGLWTLQRKREV